MKNTRNKVAGIVFVFLLILAVGFYFQHSDSTLWQHWFNMMQWLLAFWFGSKTITEVAKSKWYRSELDEKNTEKDQELH